MKVTIQNDNGDERTISIKNGKTSGKHGKKPVKNAETFDDGFIGVRSDWNYKIDTLFRNINRSRLNAKSALKGHIPFSSVMARNVRSALQECMFCCGWIIEGKKNHDSETKTVVNDKKSKDKKVTQNSGSLTSATVTSWITLLNDTEDHVLDVFNGNPYPSQQSQFDSFVSVVEQFKRFLSKTISEIPVDVL